MFGVFFYYIINYFGQWTIALNIAYYEGLLNLNTYKKLFLYFVQQ